jgi:hypothetical protein
MPTLPAATLAPAALLNGTGYTIDPQVPIDGYMGQFVLRAPAGTFAADGVEMLGIRVGELATIAKLGKLSQTEVFANALGDSAVKTGTAIGQAVLNPVETISGLPAGVGRFFQSASTSLARATESSGKNAASSDGMTDATLDALGVNEAKRKIAKQVGADPYTTNPVLAKQLDDLATAAFAGGVSLDVALAVSTAGIATAISATATVSNLVWDKSPADIRTINEGKLGAMGVPPDVVHAFVTNRWFTPTLSVPFVANLEKMPSANGRGALVALAGNVQSESEARFMVNAVDMARSLNPERGPVTDIRLAGRIMVVRTRDGGTVIPAPVDYVAWTEQVRSFVERGDVDSKRREVLVGGIVSPRAQDGLLAAGWSVLEHRKP